MYVYGNRLVERKGWGAAHVLLTFEAYEQLVGPHRALDLLAEPDGVAEIEFVAPRSGDLAQPASFD